MATHANSRPLGVIYKTTFPNGKIYIGIDVTDDAMYFGSFKHEQVVKDFPLSEGQTFTVTKEILHQQAKPEGMTQQQFISSLQRLEAQLILKHGSNNPALGYNLKPKFTQAKRTSAAASALTA